jgi:hypothetical protein
MCCGDKKELCIIQMLLPKLVYRIIGIDILYYTIAMVEEEVGRRILQ